MTINKNLRNEKAKKTAKSTPENTDEKFDSMKKRSVGKGEDEIEIKVIEELNKKHAVVHTDRFYILTEKPDPILGGVNFTLESKQSFKDLYENQVVKLSSGKTTTKVNIWLKSVERRQYDGIVFQPNSKESDKRYYNMWRGFSVEAMSGSCEKYKAHIRDVICAGNAKYFTYLWKWCARLMQMPHELAETAPVLIGEQGAGKNTFVNPLGQILGGHYLPLDNIHQLLGQFNFHLKNAVLIHGNEALWGGNRKEIGKLKAIITEKHKVIEGKGKDIIIVQNFTHLILSSNEDWPVHLDRDDRRFFVLKVSSKHKEDKDYFRAINEELQNGGLNALLYELLNEDISDFNPSEIPQNIEAFEIKLLSATPSERYLFESLKAGCFDVGNATPTENWRMDKSKYSVYNDYQAWCIKEGVQQQTSVQFGKTIKKLIPSVQTTRPRIDESRVQSYVFPDLPIASEEFQKAFKVDSSIWE